MSGAAPDPFARRAVAERLERAGRWSEALAVWGELLRANPQSALALSRVSALRAAAPSKANRSRPSPEAASTVSLPPPLGPERPAARALRAWALSLQRG